MKNILFILLFVLGLEAVAQQKRSQLQTNSQLSIAYYNTKDYEKAAPLLLEVYRISHNSYYFRLYLTSLIELKKFDEAEVQINREINMQRTPKPEFYIDWGHVLKAQNRDAEALAKYNEALAKIPATKGSYLIAANIFFQWGEYEMAQKTYLQGRQVLVGERFSYELARVYLYLRNYERMMEEYLDLIQQDEKQLRRVQGSLASAMRLDIDNGLRKKFRDQVLRRIQKNPNVTAYNRLLIWFLLQEKNFQGALRQAIALDRRTGQESSQIMQLGQMALNSKKYDNADKALEYLLKKGEASPFYPLAFAKKIHANYLKFTNEIKPAEEKGRELAVQFKKGLEHLGFNVSTLYLIKEYSHLLAFYLNEPGSAIAVLKEGLTMPRLKPEQSGVLKTEMADVYVFSNDPWEATLIYSQVIDANQKNRLGDEVKLKKAKLGYYLGNFSWAKAQLDVLKASTSKLTANDAMALSLLISNNLDLDTTAVPLQMFARADLLFFRKKDSLALTTLDSIADIYPYHSLNDDILFRKSNIEINRQNYEKAAEYLEQIVADFGYDLLADDALFALAELYNYKLNKKEKAKNLYKQMLLEYPGSVFVEESRKQYRELRKIYPDKTSVPKEENHSAWEIQPNESE
ncbi:MAG: tetratricopeptide repeat protein [Prolixibacteraceae bacterium]|nr:tetratricopeptide repeat protein [Prolixibacteraceae bacterium]